MPLVERFPELREIGMLMQRTTAIIDGEIVALNEDGLPFDGLRSRVNTATPCRVVRPRFPLLPNRFPSTPDSIIAASSRKARTAQHIGAPHIGANATNAGPAAPCKGAVGPSVDSR